MAYQTMDDLDDEKVTKITINNVTIIEARQAYAVLVWVVGADYRVLFFTGYHDVTGEKIRGAY